MTKAEGRRHDQMMKRLLIQGTHGLEVFKAGHFHWLQFIWFTDNQHELFSAASVLFLFAEIYICM